MTLMRLSLLCAVSALCFLVLNWLQPAHTLYSGLGFYFYLSITCAVALGCLGAFVFRNY